MEDCTNNIYWWKPKRPLRFLPRQHNLGDALSPFIVKSVLTNLARDKIHVRSEKRLLAIGSILNHAIDGDIVWGSGVNGTKSPADHRFQELDVRAVRGPRTRDFLINLGINCPRVYGDPGILLSKFIEPSGDKLNDELYIPHFSQGMVRRNDLRVLYTLGNNFQKFVDVVTSARVVYSASLHGIIIAEAFSVPAVLTMTSSTENLFKYSDYYEGTGRNEYPVAYSIEEARTLIPPELPNIEDVQRQLLESFPVDAW